MGKDVYALATVTSKGQLTIPKSVREALGIHKGDRVVFRVEDDCVLLAKTPELLDLAGTIAVPEGKKGATWSEIVEATHEARGRKRA
ncbi:MAG: AbrB/MazE/SpoVT family DNA-binding domain-containing protein [Gaiellaceae bacterium]